MIKVLLVDDETDALEEMQEICVRSGLECQMATDGWRALELVGQGFKPDVVVTDIRMPELGGIELSVQLRKLLPGQRLAIVFVSGHADFDEAGEAVRQGADALLSKPLRGETLIREIKLAYSKARPILQPDGDDPTTIRDDPPHGQENMQEALAALIALRRARHRHLPADIFSNASYDMLLDLYENSLTGRAISLTSLATVTGVPISTAVRRVEELEARGYCKRHADLSDKRRFMMEITDAGTAIVEKMLSDMASA